MTTVRWSYSKAKRSAERILGLDVGAATTTVASATEGDLDLVVRSDLGLAHNAARILDLVPAESVLRWLPIEMEEAEAADRLHNKVLHAGTLPQTRRDLFLEQAVAREIIRLAVADTAASSTWPGVTGNPGEGPAFDAIIASGGVLAKAPSYGQVALMLLDALQPVGASRLYLDRDRLAVVAGALAVANPLAASQILESDGLLSLGTVVTPVGIQSDPTGDQAAVFVKVERDSGEEQAVRVPFGALRVIPLQAGRTATVKVLSGATPGPEGQTGSTEVLGGVVGIIIDARGRPLPMTEGPAGQRRRVQSWLRAIGA